jgi:hypothetical protein
MLSLNSVSEEVKTFCIEIEIKYSGMWRRVPWKIVSNASEEPTASIFMAEEVFTEMSMYISVFRDVVPWNLVDRR